MEFTSTLTQSLANFYKTDRKQKAAENEKDSGDMAHVKLYEYCKRGKRQK